MVLHYLGPENSYSYLAAKTLQPQRLHAHPTVDAVVAAVDSGGPDDLGIMPYYNFLEGLVQEHLDMLYRSRLLVRSMVRLPISLSIGRHKEAQLTPTTVYSHPKALAQTSSFLTYRFPEMTRVQVNSTSEAAQLVSVSRSGLAIASRSALEKFDLEVIADDIGNRRHGRQNYTDFFLVGREPNGAAVPFVGAAMDMRTLLAITPYTDKQGVLAEMLSQFSFYGLDIAKVHSRPALDDLEEIHEPQMFYFEVRASVDAPNLSRCLDAISYRFGNPTNSARVAIVLGQFLSP